MKARLVAVFDLDGTLTYGDTYMPYLVGFFVRHPWRIFRLWNLPWYMALYAFGKFNNSDLKQQFLISFLGGVKREQICIWTNIFLDKLLRRGIRKEALITLEKHRKNGDHLVLLSASLDIYVKEFGCRLGFNETICTSVQWSNGKLSGRLSSRNCHGREKISRLLSRCKKIDTTYFIAYADDISDIPLLSMVDRGVLINGSRKARDLSIKAGIELKKW
jgi:HAD superfamily hydrolase (TIGR01490 family)